jgi:hypothetical protein
MRKYRTFGNTEFSTKQILSETKKEKKSDSKFPIIKFHPNNFDRVGRVKGNKLIFNFGLIDFKYPAKHAGSHFSLISEVTPSIPIYLFSLTASKQ